MTRRTHSSFVIGLKRFHKSVFILKPIPCGKHNLQSDITSFYLVMEINFDTILYFQQLRGNNI